MSTPEEHLEVVVGEDGSLPAVDAADLARLGAGPGEHLQLVRSPETAQPEATPSNGEDTREAVPAFFASFEGDPDLAERSEGILRAEFPDLA